MEQVATKVVSVARAEGRDSVELLFPTYVPERTTTLCVTNAMLTFGSVRRTFFGVTSRQGPFQAPPMASAADLLFKYVGAPLC